VGAGVRLRRRAAAELGRARHGSRQGRRSKARDDLKTVAARHGIEITEIAAHLQGQLVAVHPAYDLQFDNFAQRIMHRWNRQAWAVEQMKLVAKASRNLGLKNCAAFPGALAWPYLYPWPQRPPGLIEAAFDELARRWRPILDVFKDNGQNCCFEVHPGEDIFDGTTFEMFLERVNGHEACQILFDPSHFVLQRSTTCRTSTSTRTHQDVPRQDANSVHGQAECLFGLCLVGEPRRPLPFARQPGRLQRHLLQVRRL
jgi:sugar phosphate isomerase/epimerase